MFLSEDACRKRRFGIRCLDRDGDLRNDRTGVERFGDAVDAAAVHCLTIGQRSTVGMQAAVGREQ